jgi:hypothetical protein
MTPAGSRSSARLRKPSHSSSSSSSSNTAAKRRVKTHSTSSSSSTKRVKTTLSSSPRPIFSNTGTPPAAQRVKNALSSDSSSSPSSEAAPPPLTTPSPLATCSYTLSPLVSHSIPQLVSPPLPPLPGAQPGLSPPLPPLRIPCPPAPSSLLQLCEAAVSSFPARDHIPQTLSSATNRLEHNPIYPNPSPTSTNNVMDRISKSRARPDPAPSGTIFAMQVWLNLVNMQILILRLSPILNELR